MPGNENVYEADVVVVGAGLAGLVATAELTGAGKKVVLVEQEPEQSLGGQAWWSLGGLFMVDTPEQRRWGVKDSAELAWQDWSGTAAFDRQEDEWPKKWAEAYVEWAGGGKRGRDVALHGGPTQLVSGLEGPRHQDPAGAVFAVAGRDRQAAAGAAVSGL